MINYLLQFRLEYPLITLISVIFFVTLYVIIKGSGNYGVKFKYTYLLKHIYPRNNIYNHIFQIGIIVILIFYSLILGIPYLENQTERIKKEGNDIVFVFDVSYSMIARDIVPNRLEAAKDMFSDLSDELGNNRLGLVLYAGKAFQSVPLSFDTNFMKQAISDIQVESLPQMRLRELQGTAIGDGLLMGLQSLMTSDDEREKIIILMTDGEENRGIESRKVIPLLQENNIKVYSIAFGKDENATIEITNHFGIREILSVGGIDEGLLQEISKETGGEYFWANNLDTINEIIASLSKLSTGILEFEILNTKKYILKELIIALIVKQILLAGLFIHKKIQY
ncbi:VWA domain-containing protein [Candidatus Gracilibacteria bacterium]|nr:VWA domain-containing protein [Candidatus Gracilibacteria bacterium]